MVYKKRVFCVLYIMSSLFPAQGSTWHEPLSIEIIPAREKIEYGEPVILKIDVVLENPYISAYTGKPSEIYNLDGLRLAIENTKTHRSSIFIFRLPVRFQSQNDTGRGYSTDEVILWDLYKERKKLIANLIFDSPGTYRLTLKRKKKEISNAVDVVVEPSELGERALSLLAEPNDLAFLMGGLFKSPQTVSTLKEVGRQCEGTILAKWAAARLGIEYFADFHKKQPSFEKARKLHEQGKLEEEEFNWACQYLTKGTRLPDEFPLRSEVLAKLVELQYITKDYQYAINLLTELETKYPKSRYGKKASLWKEQLLAEMNKSDPNSHEQ